ncbi:hypothetical protein BDA96_01G069200 [Sorghum bicolor]|nr:hypothetical protein BDA96_01G069200 [Sorghum bicolor]
MKGVRCKRITRCIGSVGLYVPGGTAVLPSTALMLAVPAQIAGCKTIVLATPPSRDGSICKEVLYCAKKAGVTHILKAGGAQAISAMAWGTASCPKVEKIFGPGNQYVTAAKMILQNSEAMVSIDMPAGPSEVLVIADKYANPVHVAADLLSQAEHGPDSQVVLVIAGDGVNLGAIEAEVSKQCNALPRGEFASKALSHSFTVFAKDMVEAISFSNLYAPEHLIINVKDAEQWEELVENAGRVSFLGPMDPRERGRLCKRNKPCPSNLWLRKDVQWCITELFPQIHYCPIPNRGRTEKAGSIRREDGRSGRARSAQESRYP